MHGAVILHLKVLLVINHVTDQLIPIVELTLQGIFGQATANFFLQLHRVIAP